jgi:hypothetical protein
VLASVRAGFDGVRPVCTTPAVRTVGLGKLLVTHGDKNEGDRFGGNSGTQGTAQRGITRAWAEIKQTQGSAKKWGIAGLKDRRAGEGRLEDEGVW